MFLPLSPVTKQTGKLLYLSGLSAAVFCCKEQRKTISTYRHRMSVISNPRVFLPLLVVFKRKSRSGSNRGPSAYQPGSSPLGHTGQQYAFTPSWGLTSTANSYGWLGTGEGGSGGMSTYMSYTTYSLHCQHQNDSTLRRAAVWDILMFHSLCGPSHETVSINDKIWRKRRAEADRTEVLLLTSLAPYR